MSLRRNTQAAKTAPNADIGLDKFHVGQLVRAFVKSIQPFGAFLRIENSRVSGLCHRSEVGRIQSTPLSIWLIRNHRSVTMWVRTGSRI